MKVTMPGMIATAVALVVGAALPLSARQRSTLSRVMARQTSAIPSSSAFSKSIILNPTSIAPHGVKGSAQFIQTAAEGRSYALSLVLEGIPAGQYTVAVEEEQGGGKAILGPLAVVDPTTAPDANSYQDSKNAGHAHESTALRVQTQVKLPPGLNPAEVARIVVTDGAGNEVLVGTVAR